MKNSKAIWTVKTECGPIREKNEDAIYPDKSGSSNLPIKAGIFDGMGGHKKGEVASLIASEVMDDSLVEISDYVNLANKNIYFKHHICFTFTLSNIAVRVRNLCARASLSK